MSGLFRSEDMTYVRLIMSNDAAYDTVRELGKFAKLHVVDLAEAQLAAQTAAGQQATAAESSYTYYKKRVALCQFWERKLGTIEEAFNQYKIKLPDILNEEEVIVDEIRSADVIEDCRHFVDPIEAGFTKNVLFRKQHKQQMNEFVEYLYVLKFNADNKFSNPFASPDRQFEGFAQLQEEKMEYGGHRPLMNNKFTSTICGVIPADKIIPFERLLFRVSRGNAFSNFFEIPQLIEDPSTGEKIKKQVFAVTFMGEQLSKRISRIIQHAGATEYPIPASQQEIMGLQRDIQFKLNDSATVLQRTDADIKEMLGSLAVDPASVGMGGPVRSPFLNWLTALQKERRICDVLKKCDQEGSRSGLITLEGWCPSDAIEDLRLSLRQAVQVTQAKQAALQTFDHPPNGATPPTYFKTNAFTASFQGIVDTYGVPRYKEVNPGLFTIISFPFLFGIMYGDIGHGTLLFLFAAYLLFNEKKFLESEKRGTMGEIPSMVFGGRYLLIMMGFFALYAGTIYNDCFSNPVHVFESQWNPNVTDLAEYGGPYPYGVDPGWYHTSNELAFFNSMKMKLAVTLGVTQMTFGICLGAMNDIYFKDYLAIFFEFIPRLIFILATFGYMVFIIIFKMCKNWQPGSTPPLLIQTMIQMFLSPGSVTKENELYEGQGGVQAALVLAAVFSVPFMLFPIPCITNWRNKRYLRRLKLADEMGSSAARIPLSSLSSVNSHGPNEATSSDSLHERLLSSHDSAVIIDDREESKENNFSKAEVEAPDGGHGEHALGEHYSYSDHLIVQGIHTIEFVLGTVSNTASYLRLWALSLAHAELSAVFWDKMIMQYGINGSYGMGSAALGFAVWAVATFAVLLAMDVLECFLHALRLHWVEFQNKFFHADGYAFEPFSFEQISDE